MSKQLGSGTNFSTLKGWQCRAVEEVQVCWFKLGIVVGRGRIRARESYSFVTKSLNGEGINDVE